MESQTPHALLMLVVTIHLLGLASAWLARLSEGSQRQTLCQLFFLGTMTLVAISTVGMLRVDLAGGLASGMSLSIMILAVICDFRSHDASTAF